MADNLSPYLNNSSAFSKNKYVYEVSGMLVNCIAKLKEKFARDTYYLNKISQHSARATNSRPKSAYSNYKSKVNDNKIEKIKDFEMAKRRAREERYYAKKYQREKSHKKFLKEKMKKILNMHEKNKIKSIKSKMYLEQQEKNESGCLEEFLIKEALVKDKVSHVTSKKYEEIGKKSNMLNYKLQKASQRHAQMQYELDLRACQEYEASLKSSYSSFNKPNDVRNSNHLDDLLSSGKFDKLQENQCKNKNQVIAKTKEKEAKFMLSVENAKTNKLIQIANFSIINQAKQEQAKQTKLFVDSKKQEMKDQLSNKGSKTTQLVTERKRDQEKRLQLRKDLESLKNIIKERFTEAINSKNIINTSELLNALKQLIPAEYLDNPLIADELINIQNSTTISAKLASNQEAKSRASDIKQQQNLGSSTNRSNFNQSGLKNKSALSINIYSGMTYEQLEMKLDNEILNLISTEKKREELREMNLIKETNPIVKQSLIDNYNKERFTFSKSISQKQK